MTILTYKRYYTREIEMKKLISVIIILSCILIGCRGKKEYVSSSNHIQYINSVYSITDELWLSSMNGINYNDFEKGTRVYACNKLNCPHDSDSGCMAYPDEEKGEGFFEYPFLYNDKLYYFDSRYEEVLLISSNPDGSEKEVVGEHRIELRGMDVLRVESKLYYWGIVEEKESTNDGYIDTLSANYEVYEMDLISGDIKQLSNFGTFYDFNVDKLIYSDGYIYFTYMVQQNSWKDTPYAHPKDRLEAFIELSIKDIVELVDLQGVLGKINIDSGEQELYPLNSLDTIVAVTEDKIFIATEDEEELIYYDKNWENKTVLYPAQMIANGMMYTYDFIDNQLILNVFESYDKLGNYYVWDDSGNKFIDLEFNVEYSISFEASSDNKLLIALTPLKSYSTSDEWKYILADKDSFFEGKLIYTEVKVNLNE